MMMRIRLGIAMLCMLFAALVEAQPALELPKIIPPSPTAMQFQKYGDYPVSHFTGVPDISIPLYVIKEGDLELPITLTYHASGVKVSDISGYFGQGWTLNAGSMVSRTIKGNDDLIYALNPVPTEADLEDLSASDLSYMRSVYNAGGNAEYDIFSYKTNTNQGKFVIKPGTTPSIVMMPYKPLKISQRTVGSVLTGFDITDEKGRTTYFGEMSGNTYGKSLGSESWWTNQIVSATDASNHIGFRYAPIWQERMYQRHESIIFDDYASIYTGPYVPCGGSTEVWSYEDIPYRVPEVITDSRSVSDHWYDMAVPTEIVFRSGKIIFTYHSISHQLQKMEVFNTENVCIKTILFDITAYPQTTGRSKLDAVRFFDGALASQGQYSFEYNSGSVPLYTATNGIDYWGYYNGKESNANILPQWTLTTQLGLPGYYTSSTFGSADRSAVEGPMKGLSLEKITYPTGGYTVFDFEANKYEQPSTTTLGVAGGLRIKTITNYTATGSVAGVKTYQYGETGGGTLEVPITRELFYYSQVVHRLGTYYGTQLWNYRRTTFSSTPLIDLAPHGSPVVYPQVSEFNGTATVNTGKTEYLYNYTENLYDPYINITTGGQEDFPFHSKLLKRQEKDWAMGGELSGTFYYKNVNGFYELMRSEVNDYDVNIRETLRNMALYRINVYNPDCYTTPPVSETDYDWAFATQGIKSFAPANYDLVSGEIKLMKKTVTDHNAQGDFTVATEYTYDNPVHIQPTAVERVNSIGETITDKMYYPGDITLTGDPETARGLLLTANRVAEVLRMERYKGTTLLEEYKTDFKQFSTSVVQPSEIFRKEGASGSFDSRVKFLQYSAAGNLSEAEKTNDVHMSYIYDYNNKYAIAEAVNAKVSDIAYSSFETADLGGWVAASTPIYLTNGSFTGTRICRLLLGNALTKTVATSQPYKVSYWSRTGTLNVNGTSGTAKRTRNEWTLFEHSLLATTSISVAGPGEFDDLRLYPFSARMITMTYDPLVGLTSQSDVDHRTVYYEYDHYQRLHLIRDDDKNIIKRICYNYAGQPEDCSPGAVAVWQNTATAVRCKTGSTTGEQEQEQIDINPASPTYQQTQWVVIGTSPTCLSTTCGPLSCTGENKKCINNVCETGVKICERVERINRTDWVHFYHYKWSDNSTSPTYSASGTGNCLILED